MLWIPFSSLYTLQTFELNLENGFAYPTFLCPDFWQNFATSAEVQTESQAYFCNPCIFPNRIQGNVLPGMQ